MAEKRLPSFVTKDIDMDTDEGAAEYERRWKQYDRDIKALAAAGTIHQDEDGWWVDDATGELIGADPHDVRPLADEDFAKMRPFREAHPELYESIQRNKGGRPKLENPKKLVSIRLDADLVERLKADGERWQTRVNDMLRKAVGI